MEVMPYAEVKYMTKIAQMMGGGMEVHCCKVFTLFIKWSNIT